jgi:SAM-dependent methyltransferase
MDTALKFSSFRDPSGQVVIHGEKVLRTVDTEGSELLEEFLATQYSQDLIRQNKLVTTDRQADLLAHEVPAASDSVRTYRHPKISFPSYPYEWAPEMLEDAAALTLDLCEGLLEMGWGLKDATPFNVLFDGPRSVFVDVLSFEKRDALDPIWSPYNQFVKTFVLPLLANKRFGLSLRSIFLADREGLDVDAAARLCGSVAKLNPSIFSLVTLPNWLASRAESNSTLYASKRSVSESQARFILEGSFRRLRKQLRKVSPVTDRKSAWTGYTQHNVSEIPAYMSAKREIVERTVANCSPATVLDIGCNDGYFSFAAARSGSRVVAVDHDPAVVGAVWRTAKEEDLNVLPLVVDVGRPSPRMGWQNAEYPSFLDRAKGHFDMVMMLAVLHHILVQDRAPLREVLRLASELTRETLIIEFVPPSDKLFQKILRGRGHLHEDLTPELFERTAGEFFEIAESHPLPETERILYVLKRK